MTVEGVRLAGRREWIGLAVLALPTMLLSLDISVLFLAIPPVTAGLGASSTEQLWITDIYGFMMAGFLVTMGNLGDRIGRRRLLLIGATGFSAMSVLAAFAGSPLMLILARAALGIAGAAVLPCTLALVRTMFSDPHQLGRAFACWSTSFMGGAVLGPVVGGALLSNFWWGSVFLPGVPVMVLLLLVGRVLLPESRDPRPGRLDFASVVLSLGALLPAIYGLKELARHGLRSAALAAIVAGLAVGVLFVRRQRRLASPLLELELFRHRVFTAALVIGLCVGSLQGGIALVLSLYLQMVMGFSPLRSGLWLAPAALALMLAINLTPVFARRMRPGYVVAAGMTVAVAGQLLLLGVDAGALAVPVIGVCVVYLGVGTVPALINHLALGSAPPERAGSAASLMGTGGELGVAFGIAALGSLATAVYRGQLAVPAGTPAGAAAAARDNISSAVSAAGHLPAPLGPALLDHARSAFTSGLHVVALASALAFVGLVVLAARMLAQVPAMGAAVRPGQQGPPSRPVTGR